MLWWEQFPSQNPAPELWWSDGHRPHPCSTVPTCTETTVCHQLLMTIFLSASFVKVTNPSVIQIASIIQSLLLGG